MWQQVPVLEVGGTHVVAALVDTRDWSLTARTRLPVDAAAPAQDILATYVAAAAGVPVPARVRWGVAMPDPFDYATGIARFRGVGKYESLDGIDVGARLRELIPQTPHSIVFRNDADAFILGEWCAGQAIGQSRCVGITLGTGLGTGWIVDGAITTSEPGIPPLGRARTINLDGVGLEEIVSTRGIRRRYVDAGGAADLDVREIAALAGEKDPRAAAVLFATFIDLGRGLGPALRDFRPDVVVVGGSMAAAWPLVAAAFEEGLNWPTHPPVRVSESTEDAALRGIACATMTLHDDERERGSD